MNVVEHVRTGADPEELFAMVADLGTYPDWMGLVVRADAEAPTGREVQPAWVVELRGRIGPLARAKRLRMVRTRCEESHVVCFERVESDGRNHSTWVLQASVVAAGDGSLLTMELHYGGSRFAPVLAPILRDEIGRARRVLEERYPL